jgi:mono/diheme cytochrome c family protein
MTGIVLASSVSHAVNEERARVDYANYCAACHGMDGTGNGPMASELKSSPTDLTTLTKKNNGYFPYIKIRRVIDGSLSTGSIRAHGSGDMPVWGDVFRRQGSDVGKWNDAQAKIMNIVDYLSSIQK